MALRRKRAAAVDCWRLASPRLSEVGQSRLSMALSCEILQKTAPQPPRAGHALLCTSEDQYLQTQSMRVPDELQNSHRATRFNDNLDGTLTDLGLYADANHGNGSRTSSGFAKPGLVVSKRLMSLSESPMVEVSYRGHQRSLLKGTVPERGGPGRRSNAPVEDSDDSDSLSDESLQEANPANEPQQPSPAVDKPGRMFNMANPDRPYNQWLGEGGLACWKFFPLTCCGRPVGSANWITWCSATGRVQARHNIGGAPVDMSCSLLSPSVFIHQDPRTTLRCEFAHSPDWPPLH